MSERGQKIFKICVWIAIFGIAIFKLVSFGIELLSVQTEKAETQEVARAEDSMAPVDYSLKDGEIGELLSDADGVVKSEPTEVTFWVKANTKNEKVELFAGDELIGEMKDEGNEGDDFANDGFYSLTTEIMIEEGDKEFVAKMGDKQSKSKTISAYDEIQDQDFDEMQSVIDKITEIEAEYLVDGYVPEDKRSEAIDKIYEGTLAFIEENKIEVKEIEKSENGIFILFSSGIQYVYSVKDMDSEEGEGDDIYLSVGVLEPYLTSGDSQLHSLASFSDSAELIDSSIEGASYTFNYSDSEVTLENIVEAFKPNRFIIWHGHGGYDEKVGSFLGVGEVKEKTYVDRGEITAGRLVIVSHNRLGITHKFFEKYVDDLSGSFVYLGGCHTGQDKNLMEIMIKKNAEVSVGFSDSVLTVYDCNVMKTMTEQLCTIDKKTNQYRTIGNALKTCAFYYGADDGDSTPAKILYLGNEDYRIDDLVPKPDPIDIELPDMDKLGQDVKDDMEQKIEDKTDAVLDDLAQRLDKALSTWLNENCGGC